MKCRCRSSLQAAWRGGCCETGLPGPGLPHQDTWESTGNNTLCVRHRLAGLVGQLWKGMLFRNMPFLFANVKLSFPWNRLTYLGTESWIIAWQSSCWLQLPQKARQDFYQLPSLWECPPSVSVPVHFLHFTPSLNYLALCSNLYIKY